MPLGQKADRLAGGDLADLDRAGDRGHQATFIRMNKRDVDLIAISIMKGCSLYEAINWLDYGRPYEVTRP